MPEVVTKQQFWRNSDGSFHDKKAEAANTYLMPGQEPSDKKVSQRKASVVRKEGSAFERFIKTGSAEPPDDNLEQPVMEKQPEKNPQAAVLKPHVDVSGQEPPKLVTEKKAQHYALPSINRYPLDSWVQVKTAAEYFDENRKLFHPDHRREFCVHLEKRASQLGIEVSSDVEKYASVTYAPMVELKVSLDGRRCILDEDDTAVLNKLAACQIDMTPGEFALALSEFDKMAGIDSLYDTDIPDPYYSTFGKTAADTTTVLGNDIITDEQLKDWGKKGFSSMVKSYGEEMATEFRKDPKAIFDSLPVDQKKRIIQMATDNSPAW